MNMAMQRSIFDKSEEEKVKIIERILRTAKFKKKGSDYVSDKVMYANITLFDDNDIFIITNHVSFTRNSVKEFMGSVYFLIGDLHTSTVDIDAIKILELGVTATAQELNYYKVNKRLIAIAEQDERMIKKLLTPEK
jgi:hypothetical protein